MTTVLAPLQNGGLEQPGLDPRVLQCGFARLLGKDVDYIVRKYEIVLGRRSKASTLDVILGDFMSVSRQHARILYSFPSGVPHIAQWPGVYVQRAGACLTKQRLEMGHGWCCTLV